MSAPITTGIGPAALTTVISRAIAPLPATIIAPPKRPSSPKRRSSTMCSLCPPRCAPRSVPCSATSGLAATGRSRAPPYTCSCPVRGSVGAFTSRPCGFGVGRNLECPCWFALAASTRSSTSPTVRRSRVRRWAFGRLLGATVRFTSVGGTSFRCDFSRKSVLPALLLFVFQAKYEQSQKPGWVSQTATAARVVAAHP